MRIGLALSAGDGPDPLARLLAQALAAEARGLDLLWLESEAVPAPLLSAAALAARTTSVRIAACVPAGPHPLAIAEAASVADNCSAGRLILAISDRDRDVDLLAETVDALLAATAPRPFRHVGRRWRIPARLPENDGATERIVLTPPTVQLELPLWLCGPGAADVARPRCLSAVSGLWQSEAEAEAGWAASERDLAAAAARLRRPAVRALACDASGLFDDEPIVARLRAEQRAWGLDVAILQLPDGLEDSALLTAIELIATRVRPRLIQDELPAGLEDHWRSG